MQQSDAHQVSPLLAAVCRVALTSMLALVLSACTTTPAKQHGKTSHRPLILVPLAEGPAWQDMAVLAAVPSACVAHEGKPAVMALPASEAISPEAEDYLRRYRPTAVYALGSKLETVPGAAAPVRTLQADSAPAAACVLAQTFWTKRTTVVMCPGEDYASGLLASTLAARLASPLLFCSGESLSLATAAELKRLGVKEAVLIGGNERTVLAIRQRVPSVTRLADPGAVFDWMRKRALAADYIAAVNPRDRTDTVIKKLSLAGAMLAAGNRGMALPLAYDMEWKRAFTGEPVKEDLPEGIPVQNGKKPPRKGRIELDGQSYTFIATGGFKAGPHRLFIDLNGDGAMTGPGEGPRVTGDIVTLGGKEYAVTLGEESGVGKADLRLTHPTARQVRADLKAHYERLGADPEYLCLVGFPDALPHAIVPREPGKFGDLLSDLPYADTDGDPFAELCVARLVAEHAPAATLYASRVLTYGDLLDPAWQDRVGQARWENTYGDLYENVGFEKPFRHDVQDLAWIVEPDPEAKKKGKRSRTFKPDSPLTQVAAMTHMAHSWWKDLGETYSWEAEVLLAPTLIESGGCLTASLDREPDCRSVIARLFRNGAVGFVGNIRPGMANQEQLRAEFWNGVLSGQSIGQAHRRAQNSMMLTVLDNGQQDGGYHHYSLYIRTLFGDPAFVLPLPSPPRSAFAHTASAGDRVSVHGPETWWPVRIRVPEDWKRWRDKDLYVCRGAGTYPVRTWCDEEYDRETTFCNAEIRTRRRIASLIQAQAPPAPLGWKNTYWADEHADGTRTYRWRVQLIDFDQLTGLIKSKADRLDYNIRWQAD